MHKSTKSNYKGWVVNSVASAFKIVYFALILVLLNYDCLLKSAVNIFLDFLSTLEGMGSGMNGMGSMRGMGILLILLWKEWVDMEVWLEWVECLTVSCLLTTLRLIFKDRLNIFWLDMQFV